MTLVEKTMSGADALQLIEQQVIPLLQIARENIATYTSSPQRLQRLEELFNELESYVKLWFNSSRQTSNAIHEPRREIGNESREVVLQRKVEELEKLIKYWENKYSKMEQDRNNINIGYRMVIDEKKKIEDQKKALATVNNNLQHTQADKNAEILTLKVELGRLKGEVARLEGEVERLTIQNKRKSSSNWSFFRNKTNMQTLLEDLNNFRK
jgi:chromosome segregation ATPase